MRTGITVNRRRGARRNRLCPDRLKYNRRRLWRPSHAVAKRMTAERDCYNDNNRTHMVRIPEPGRFELRLMHGAANPYLLQAGILAGGLDGVAKKRDPGKRLDI